MSLVEMTFHSFLHASTYGSTSFVDQPVGGRDEDLQGSRRPQDDADGEAEQLFVQVVQPHADHVVLGSWRDEQLLANGEVLQ